MLGKATCNWIKKIFYKTNVYALPEMIKLNYEISP